MQTIWPAYEGSVRTSWYPVIAVLKTTSPSPTTSAPSGAPTKARPSSSTSTAYDLAGNDHRLVDAVFLVDEDVDPLGVRRRHVLADVVRTDRKLTMSTVDKDRKLDRARPAEIHQRIHRGAGRTSVMNDVVDQHYHLAAHVGQIARRPVTIWGPEVEVVAMLRDIEAAEGNSSLLELAENHGQALREDVAFADDADDHHILDAAIALHDLVRDPMQRATDLVGVHHGRFEAPLPRLRGSRPIAKRSARLGSRDAHERRRSKSAMRMCRPLRAWRK